MTGTLNIVADDGDGEDTDYLNVYTGLNDTTIEAADADDVVTVYAEEMADGTTLMLSGAAETTVDEANGSITIEGNDATLGALTGELRISSGYVGEDGESPILGVKTILYCLR